MSGGKGNYINNGLLNAVLNHAAMVALPSTVYVALFTANPTDAGGGTEVTGGSYARVAVVANTTNFPTTTSESISNATVITFPNATASWGTVTGAAIFDAATAGNLLYWAPLTTSQSVGIGVTAEFLANALTFTEA